MLIELVLIALVLIALVLIPLVMIALVSGDDSSGAGPIGADSTGADSTGADSTDAGDDSTQACVHSPEISTSSKEIAQIYQICRFLHVCEELLSYLKSGTILLPHFISSYFRIWVASYQYHGIIIGNIRK